MFRVLCLVLLAAGCGGAPDAVRGAIAGVATAVEESDAPLTRHYQETHTGCLENTAGWASYDECMTHAENVADVHATARESLYTLEGAADAWDSGAEEDWSSLASCSVQTLEKLLAVFTAAGWNAPEELGQAIGLLSGFGGSCDE